MHRHLSLGHRDYQTADSVSHVVLRRNFEENIGFIVCRHSVGGIATGHGLGRTGDRTPVRTRFSAPIQTVPGALPASCTMGAGSLSRGYSSRGLAVFTHPNRSLKLTLRRLMSYIYGAPILDVSRPHTTTQHSR